VESDAPKYSDRARAIVCEAENSGDRAGIVDVLVAIMTIETGVGQQVLNEAGVERQGVLGLSLVASASVVAALPSIRLIAECEARDLSHPYVGSEHLLLACLRLLEGTPEEALIRQVIPCDYASAKDAVLRLWGKPYDPKS